MSSWWYAAVFGWKRFVHEAGLLPEVLIDYARHYSFVLGNDKRLSSSQHHRQPWSVSGLCWMVMEYVVRLGEVLVHTADKVRHAINDLCIGVEPWQVVAYTCAIMGVHFWVYLMITQSPYGLRTRLKRSFFRWLRRLPWIKRKIESELSKTQQSLYEDLHKCDVEKKFHLRLVEQGMSGNEIINLAKSYDKMGSFDYAQGKVSGTVYKKDTELISIISDIFKMYYLSNPLHPDVFPGCRKMEAEVVRMVAHMFHGDGESCGVVTSGGTESILLACLACRNRAYDKGITDPEMVIPATAHAAFDKAADLFRIRIKHVPINKETFKVDVRSMRKAITSSTCMLVASAPNFPHGIIDPVEEIGKLGKRYDIPVHVDACLGGFLVAFMDEAGYPLPKFDFRVDGVTSISCDTHKYGFAVKGSSVVLFNSRDLLHYQFFCQPDWPGGVYASPTLAGSRSGANIAACWAALMYHGRSGYVETTRKIIKTTRFIDTNLRQIEGLTVLGQPQVSVIAFTSYVFNVYNLCDRLKDRGWHLNALQFPSAVHICITMTHTAAGIAERFVQDSKEICAELVANPNVGDGKMAAIYGTAQAIPDRSIIAELCNSFLDACYSTKQLPDKN